MPSKLINQDQHKMKVFINKSEQKTFKGFDELIPEWQIKKPQIQKEIDFEPASLIGLEKKEFADMICPETHQLFQFKWGNDLKTSLNGNHLRDQLKNMRLWSNQQKISYTLHVFTADDPHKIISIEEYQRVVSLCCRFDAYPHLRYYTLKVKDPILEALDSAIAFCRNPISPLNLGFPTYTDKKKSSFLLLALASIQGCTIEFADQLIDEKWTCLMDLENLTEPVIFSKAKAYYAKEMNELTFKIYTKIHGRK
jgi:hypothetical protein